MLLRIDLGSCASPHLLAVILNEELGALAQACLVPVHRGVQGQGASQGPRCPLALIRYLWGLGGLQNPQGLWGKKTGAQKEQGREPDDALIQAESG